MNPTLNDLNHAYNRGYGDGRQGKQALTWAWAGDELKYYKQGYDEGKATISPTKTETEP